MTYFEELTNTRLKRPSSMVAGISSKVLQIRKESIKQSLSDLNTIGHRQEYIATVNGVMYYDDSRAENVNATSPSRISSRLSFGLQAETIVTPTLKS